MNARFVQVCCFQDRILNSSYLANLGNQKLEIWKRTDGTIVGRSLDDGQSMGDQNEFDGSVSQQEVNPTNSYSIPYTYPSLSLSIVNSLVYLELYYITRETVYENWVRSNERTLVDKFIRFCSMKEWKATLNYVRACFVNFKIFFVMIRVYSVNNNSCKSWQSICIKLKWPNK